MLGLHRNDCETCGDPKPVEPQVNLQVTKLDVDTFPVWIKYGLVLLEKGTEKIEGIVTIGIVGITAAIVFIPSFSKGYEKAVRVAFNSDSEVNFSNVSRKQVVKVSNSAQTPARDKAGIKDSWPKVIKKTPVIGQTILAHKVTSLFGERERPCPTCSKYHRGVDLATPTGTPVKAIGLPGARVEVTCNYTEGGGNQGFIRSSSIPNKEFVAVHLNECKSGIYKAGDVFGKTGNTGMSTGEHLHIEEHHFIDGKKVAVAPSTGYILWLLSGSPPALPTQGSAPLAKSLGDVVVDVDTNRDRGIDPAAIYAKLLPSSFAIAKGKEIASGFVVSADGKALTNSHVVFQDKGRNKSKSNAEENQTVRFADGRTYGYKVLKIDRNLDIALIQILASGTKFTPVKFADAVPSVGEPVFSVGNSQGQFPSDSQGAIVDLIRVGDILAQIETSSGLVHHGSSGSAAVNAQGEVIGQVKGMIESGKDDLNRPVKQERIGDGILSTAQQLREFISGGK